MKKIHSLWMLAAFVLPGITACDTETDVSAGGTTVQSMAGLWDVAVDVMEIDENGDTIHYGDYYDYGTLQFYTYNTADNRSDSIFVDDAEVFWPVKGKVGCNLATLSFSGTDIPNMMADSETFRVVGKVLPRAATNLHGKPNDSIWIDFEFDSDPGFIYRYAGQRYTGFYE